MIKSYDLFMIKSCDSFMRKSCDLSMRKSCHSFILKSCDSFMRKKSPVNYMIKCDTIPKDSATVYSNLIPSHVSHFIFPCE